MRQLDVTEDIQKFISYASIICGHGVANAINQNRTSPSPVEILRFFINIQWWNGVLLTLDRHPAKVVQSLDLHTNIMSELLSKIGRCCRLTTVWKVILNEQDLLADV
uniref:Uncharacterized protein n=1 Tax=Ditylum brightwellii TaxID=49249 RepID=A0A7S4RVF6_9STRA